MLLRGIDKRWFVSLGAMAIALVAVSCGDEATPLAASISEGTSPTPTVTPSPSPDATSSPTPTPLSLPTAEPEAGVTSYQEGVGVLQTPVAESVVHLKEGTPIEYTVGPPPASGDHWPIPVGCGFYDYSIPDEVIIHNLEHGNVVVSYNLSDSADVATLRDIHDALPGSAEWLITRFYDGIPQGDIVVAAWGIVAQFTGMDEERIQRFFNVYQGNHLSAETQQIGRAIPCPTPTLVELGEEITIKQYSAPPPLIIDPNKRYVAKINTNQGAITLDLFPKEAPKTVNNFVFLARDGFYDGVVFHRVIPSFMIQGGDPTGTGRAGPGYTFEDEFDPSLVFDSPGLLAMANSGPSTNGSQFFITVAPTPHLNGRHTIFGRVVEGQDIADAISLVATGAGDKPVEPVVMESVIIDELEAN